MGDIQIATTNWRLVELGRVAIITNGEFQGRLAAIVEIIDHKRVLIDGPASTPEKAVPRQSIALSQLSLTPIVIPKLPRATGTGKVRSLWEKEEVEKKFESSSWAQTRSKLEKRRQLNDFERFKVMRLRKQARFEVQKAYAKIRASAKA